MKRYSDYQGEIEGQQKRKEQRKENKQKLLKRKQRRKENLTCCFSMLVVELFESNREVAVEKSSAGPPIWQPDTIGVAGDRIGKKEQAASGPINLSKGKRRHSLYLPSLDTLSPVSRRSKLYYVGHGIYFVQSRCLCPPYVLGSIARLETLENSFKIK